MTTTLTITWTTIYPRVSGPPEHESVVLPMPSSATARNLMRSICDHIELAHTGGDFDCRSGDPNHARITLASGDRITLRVGES